MSNTARDIIEINPPQAQAIAPSSEAANIMAVISRAAADPNTDVTKLERLMDMYERITKNSARAAYAAAFSKMQPEIPTIDRNGKIVVYSKADRDYAAKNGGEYPPNATPQQATPYALFEDINDAVRPVLALHGFGMSFRTGQTPEGKITVTGILSHEAGHSEETTMALMHDSSGSKNNVQAIGSSMSYGKRYTMMALLNISSRAPQDADDDGKAAGAPLTISEDEQQKLQSLMIETSSDPVLFLDYYKISRLDELPKADFPRAVAAFEKKKGRK